MDDITRDLPFVFVYIDDLLIASKSKKQHLEHLKILFQRLDEAGLVINTEKTLLGQSEVSFLGHTVSKHGIQPLPAKVQAINNVPSPTTIKQLRRFLGMINFYRRFIKNAATILAPFNHLLQGTGVHSSLPITWSTDVELAFIQAKKALASATLLVHPKIDAEWGIFSDASGEAIGSVLQ
uniref:Reverse transcriptase domain-containing protein n=1 Tax=Bracon brevicornis TaxID=1563983 RepID=A0A6V7KUY4_9HYME